MSKVSDIQIKLCNDIKELQETSDEYREKYNDSINLLVELTQAMDIYVFELKKNTDHLIDILDKIHKNNYPFMEDKNIPMPF